MSPPVLNQPDDLPPQPGTLPSDLELVFSTRRHPRPDGGSSAADAPGSSVLHRTTPPATSHQHPEIAVVPPPAPPLRSPAAARPRQERQYPFAADSSVPIPHLSMQSRTSSLHSLSSSVSAEHRDGLSAPATQLSESSLQPPLQPATAETG